MNPNFNPIQNNFNFIPNQIPNNFNPNILPMNNNNFSNQFFMNNPIPMMQMNQMMMPNMNNQINQINNNINLNINQNINNQNNMNYNFKNQNQKILVDKIIDFYERNNRKYMNYNEPNQIKKLLDNLDINSPNLKEGNDIDDPMPYINEKKKLIKFINHDSKIFNVKVPRSIDKMTLYQIARKYQNFYNSNILLIYMNCILNEDESSIECISDDDYVIIIEDIYYLDDSYLNSLFNTNSNNISNITIIMERKPILNIPVFAGTKFSQVFKALLFHFGCNYQYHYNGKFFDGENKKTNMLIPEKKNIAIECSNVGNVEHYGYLGKIISIKTIFSDEKGTDFSSYPKTVEIGLLNSTTYLFSKIENLLEWKIKKIYFGGKEINCEEEKSLLSLGINENSSLSILVDLLSYY